MANIFGWKSLVSLDTPWRVFVARSVKSKYSEPSASVCSSMSPQHISVCSWRPRKPKCIVLFSHNVCSMASGLPNKITFKSYYYVFYYCNNCLHYDALTFSYYNSSYFVKLIITFSLLVPRIFFSQNTSNSVFVNG